LEVERQPAEYLPLYGIRQRFVLFRVGTQKPEHADLVRALVGLLIGQIPPVGERIVGRWLTLVGAHLVLGERLWGRFGHSEAVGGEFEIGAIHQAFSSCRLYFVFGIDRTTVVVHPDAIEKVEAVMKIRRSERLEL